MSYTRDSGGIQGYTQSCITLWKVEATVKREDHEGNRYANKGVQLPSGVATALLQDEPIALAFLYLVRASESMTEAAVSGPAAAVHEVELFDVEHNGRSGKRQFHSPR